MSEAQKRVVELKKDIEAACIRHNLNITVHDGKIGFVDQEERKIVSLWSPEYYLSDT